MTVVKNKPSLSCRLCTSCQGLEQRQSRIATIASNSQNEDWPMKITELLIAELDQEAMEFAKHW
ncbi:MAG: hypothetical protein WBQ95_22295, partial [Terracidiphilus sp.]